MAQLLSNEDEVLEAFDPSIAASRRFKYVLVFEKNIQDDYNTYFLDIQLLFFSIWHFVH
jgi:hypothetical protein